MDKHPLTWTAPEPLWQEVTAANTTVAPVQIQTPAILRFTTDDFMSDFMNVLATDPQRLGEYRLLKETWRGVVTMAAPTSPKKSFALPLQRLGATRQRLLGIQSPTLGKAPTESSNTTSVPLKLYQPAHQRYYLVTACLVCQRPGLPDRKVDAGRQEVVGFVIRRLFPPAGGTEADPAGWPEYAWVEKNSARHWAFIAPGKAREPAVSEEILPLFGVNHFQDDQRLRRLFAGLIPVGKREAYLAAPKAEAGTEPAAGVSSITARKVLLRKEVIEPWKALVTSAALAEATAVANAPGNSMTATEITNAQAGARNNARHGLQVGSYYVLLDFARFLEAYVDDVWKKIAAIHETPPRTLIITGPSNDLYDSLFNLVLGNNLQTSLNSLKEPSFRLVTRFTDALFEAHQAATLLESAVQPFDITKAPGEWPDFLFPLADPQWPNEAALPPMVALPAQPDADRRTEEEADLPYSDDSTATDTPDERIDRLAVLILRAMPATTDQPQPAVPAAALQPADPLGGWFVIRCVHLRPNCGPLHKDVVSERTAPFQLAGFFDPDAPARPIRIGLPIDTTPAGLRKFDRNTAFVLSNTLCGQIARLKGLTFGDLIRSVLPWPLHKDLDVGGGGPCATKGTPSVGFGTICSLSIPIITICALILLMIMVNVLNMIFRWIPFFILCFPLPGLKAKQS